MRRAKRDCIHSLRREFGALVENGRVGSGAGVHRPPLTLGFICESADCMCDDSIPVPFALEGDDLTRGAKRLEKNRSPKKLRIQNLGSLQYDSSRTGGRLKRGEVNLGMLTHRGRVRRKPGRSSPAGVASMGPSALNRRTGAVRSAVRSHAFGGWRPAIPRRHHCRPPALLHHV
jgi:hypothetical protein